jgi:hypothetical protein
MQISDLQYKVIATLFVPSSMRRAALTGLKVGDLFTLSHYPQIYGIYVYSGKPEEYFIRIVRQNARCLSMLTWRIEGALEKR